jgi:hypothetical protein
VGHPHLMVAFKDVAKVANRQRLQIHAHPPANVRQISAQVVTPDFRIIKKRRDHGATRGGIAKGFSYAAPQEWRSYCLSFGIRGASMTMRLADYYCAVVRRDVVFRVNYVQLRNSLGETVDKRTRFTSCTGHPACGTFPKGLPQNVDELPSGLTGCPLVDSHTIPQGTA